MPGSSDPICSPPPRDSTPDRQDDDGPYDRADQTGAFAGTVPTQSLTQKSGNERTDNPEDGCQDEASGLVAARHDQLGNHARDEPDDDRPDYAHSALQSGCGLESSPAHSSDVKFVLVAIADRPMGAAARRAKTPLRSGAGLAACTYRLRRGGRGKAAQPAPDATILFVSTRCPTPPGRSPARAGPA